MSTECKIKNLADLEKLAQQQKDIVLCHGVFDLVHPGHLRYLKSAKKMGKYLVVSITADAYVKRGPGRPYFSQDLRAEQLASLEIVDCVVVAETESAVPIIRALKPKYYVKGPDYKNRKQTTGQKLAEEQNAVNEYGGELVFTDDISFSSSYLLNTFIDSCSPALEGYLKQFRQSHTISDVSRYLENAKDLNVLLIGDTIVDVYSFCKPMSQASKEHMIVHKHIQEEAYAGGVIAAARHVAELCSKVRVVTMLGERNSYRDLIESSCPKNIELNIVTKQDCPTNLKKRYIIEGSNTRLFEICDLNDRSPNKSETLEMRAILEQRIAQADLVLVFDFGHGLMSKELIEYVTSSAKCLAVNVQTNGANRGYNLVTKYKTADLICLREEELRLALVDRETPIEELLPQALTRLDCRYIEVTCSKNGSVSFSEKAGLIRSPALTTQVVDTTGAGDAFLSYLAPVFALNAPPKVCSFLANAAGGTAIQIRGNSNSVKKSDVEKFAKRLLSV